MNIIITDDDNKNQLFTGTSIDDAINYLKNIKEINEQTKIKFENDTYLDNFLKEILKDFFCHYDVDTISIDKQTNNNFNVYIELYTTDVDTVKSDSKTLEKNITKVNKEVSYDLDIEEENDEYEEIKVIINIENLDLSLNNKINLEILQKSF